MENKVIKRHYWSAEDDALMRAHYADTPNKELAASIGVTRLAVCQRARTLGLHKPPGWTDENTDTFRRLYPILSAAEICEAMGISMNAVHYRAQHLGLHKTREWVAERARQNIAHPDHPARQSRFAPGLVPWNKGQPHPSRGRSAETQFKPGKRQGRAAQLWQPIGHTRRTDEGYLQRKVSDTGRTPRDYVSLHHLVWRMHGGTIPKGHVVIFRDRNPENLDINNLELISRAELIRRNSVHRYPENLKAAIRAKSSLVRKLNQLEKEHRATHQRSA
jgi:hypothetical protein